MIIGCPECKTRFVVSPAAIGKEGRLVKCSKCMHTWFQEAPPEELEQVPEQVIEEAKPSATKTPQTADNPNPKEEEVRPGDEPLRKNVPVIVKGRGTGVIVGWSVLLIFLLGTVILVVFFRSALEDQSDVAKGLYNKWDLLMAGEVQTDPVTPPPNIVTVPHPASFLEMRQSFEIEAGDNGPNLIIFLDIQNKGDENVTLPDLQGIIRDGDGQEVFTWSQTLNPSTVAAGGVQQYELYVDSIQTRSRSAEVYFNWENEN